MDQETFQLLRESIRRFVEREVVTKAQAWELQGFVPREVLREMGRLGFLGLRYPEEFGGGALDARATALLAEELGRSTFGGFAITVLVHTDMATPHLVNAGSSEQIQRYLPRLVSGELISAVAITEPDAGSDVKAIRTSARRVSPGPGGDWVLNGSKMFITNGALADLYFVAAKTDPAAGSKGISMFMVEKGMPGFSVGRKLDKMGWRSSDTAELVFDDCRVPAANLLGEEGKGFYAVMKNFQNERIAIAAMTMGEAARALELTLEYVRTRKAFGATLWDKQAIRQRLSMLAAKVEAGRQLVLHAASLDAQGGDCVKEVSMAKAYCAELLNDVVYDCLQFHGGFGYLKESTIERMYRDARVQPIGGGATEVMLEEVAKRL
ncbi:MAG: acyl-CoA dehydrogenase [Betaproteobacteria bacterium]|nr:acyl-CoA dehydrogenase [Betaproteobacteria bacterium]MSQ88742.1 acyl-CoA dehydrogenase [Betaproteobacteria bacterium]